MATRIDFSIATSEQIEDYLDKQLLNIRLTRNITQIQLAKASNVAFNTIRRLENGQNISLDTFIRILIAFGLQNNLKTLLPDITIRPIERVKIRGVERKRARPSKQINENSTWSWGDESIDKK
jgi:transcriptional regulator with XRE-family HTH domain